MRIQSTLIFISILTTASAQSCGLEILTHDWGDNGVWKNRPLTCKVRNDGNKAAEFDPKEGYACSELRQPSKEVCSALGPDSIVDVLFEWEVCNTRSTPIKLDLAKSKAKFTGGAVVSDATENGIKTMNVPIKNKDDMNWEGRIEANSCVIAYAEVDINKCKATFDSGIFVITENGGCSAEQTTGDWILRRCNVFAEVDCFIGDTGRSCSRALEEINSIEDAIEKSDAYKQIFCQEEVTYVYRVCNEGAFDMKFKNSGPNPSRAALKYSPDDIEDIDKTYDILQKYDGIDNCPYVFKHTLNPAECLEFPSTFIDVKGQLFSESEGINKLLERKFNGCWSRDVFDFNLGFDLLDPFPDFPEKETEEEGVEAENLPPAPTPTLSLPSKSKGKGKGTTSQNFFLRRHGSFDV